MPRVSRSPRPARRGCTTAANLPARSRQRCTGRPADRPPGFGTDPARPGRRERVRGIAEPEHTWFRYHHLLADLLRLELRRTRPEDVPALHRRAAEWFTRHGHVTDAIRHTQAAGDWPDAARLLAEHSFSLTLDGQVQTVQALLRAFPPGACDVHPELAVARATVDLLHGRLDEAAARLTVAESHVETVPPDRRPRLQVAIASLKLSQARRRGHLADVIERAGLLATPGTGPFGEDIVLGRDLRAVALMNLGTAEAWSAGLHEGERHLREGAVLAREIGPTSRSDASRNSLSLRRSTHSLPPSDAAGRRSRSPNGTAGARSPSSRPRW